MVLHSVNWSAKCQQNVSMTIAACIGLTQIQLINFA
jgi:hypothetical protein